MSDITDLLDVLIEKARQRYRKLLIAETRGNRNKAKKHERKLLALNLRIGFFKRQRKNSPSDSAN